MNIMVKKTKLLTNKAEQLAEEFGMIGTYQTVGLDKIDISKVMEGCNKLSIMHFVFEDMKKKLHNSSLKAGEGKKIKGVAIHIKGGKDLSTLQSMEVVENVSNIVPKATIVWGATANGNGKRVMVTAILGVHDKSPNL